jgi:hypothetical protein
MIGEIRAKITKNPLPVKPMRTNSLNNKECQILNPYHTLAVSLFTPAWFLSK